MKDVTSGKTADLEGSEAYRVDTEDGRIGTVVAVLPCAGRGSAGVLLVRTGLLHCQLSAVPFGAVESVDPVARRILLASSLTMMQRGTQTGARARIVAHA